MIYKKNGKIALLFMALVMLLGLCACGDSDGGQGGKGKQKEINTPEGMAEVYQVALTVASPNVNHIHYVRYPYYYASFSESNSYGDLDLDYDTEHFIPQEDLDFFLDFIEKYDNSAERTDNSVFTYCLRVSYYPEDSDSEYSTLEVAYGYDSFPEELNEVIDRVNSLCGDDLLEYPTEMIEDVPSFIYEETKVSEDDYPREDIENMLEERGLFALDDMFSSAGGFAGLMGSYYSSVAAKNIEDITSRGLLDATEISDDDYTEFVEKYIGQLSGDWEMTHGLSLDGLTMIHKDGHPTHGYMYIGKAEIVSEWEKNGDLAYDENGNKCIYMMPDGEEGMTKGCKFVYNKDASVILVDYDCAGLDYDEYVELFYDFRDKMDEIEDEATEGDAEEGTEEGSADYIEIPDELNSVQDILGNNTAKSHTVSTPSGLSDSLDDMSFMFDGEIYQIPFGISSLSSDWKIKGKLLDSEKELKTDKKVEQYYKNENYDDRWGFVCIKTENQTNSVVAYEDSTVCRFNCSLYVGNTDEYPELILSKGITWGSSLQDIYDAYGEPTYIAAVNDEGMPYLVVMHYFLNEEESKGYIFYIDLETGLNSVSILDE